MVIDIPGRRIYPGTITWANGIIAGVEEDGQKGPDHVHFILPGFVDSHIHIESSMLTPYEFARKALIHGTVATISDPHEIANVCGIEGVEYMLENARQAKLKFHFGAPSCVPATAFETAGARLDSDQVTTLLQRDDIYYLSEMMNYPGVLFSDSEVLKKIAAARQCDKPVDGHAPGLTGEDAIKYIAAGITTDHECFSKPEALHKLKNGMKILIREGSAARNFEALHELITEHTDMVMLCSDDKHPDELIHGHINDLVRRALAKGHNLFDVLRCACVNPVNHYKMRSGLLRIDDPADFIVVDDTSLFNVLEVYIDGEKLVSDRTCILPKMTHEAINRFNTPSKNASDFEVPAKGNMIRVIDAIDGQLVTELAELNALVSNGNVISDTNRDILKLTVVNRYEDQPPAMGFIRNFNLKRGAIASTVAHDSHNIIAAGCDDESIARAVNLLIKNKGGLSLADGDQEMVLPLPVAGLMSTLSCDEVGELYSVMDKRVKQMGCKLRAPYMTLSFMALLVIPRMKLSDKGLFDGSTFAFTKLFSNSD
jgi:adenine deaminase